MGCNEIPKKRMVGKGMRGRSAGEGSEMRDEEPREYVVLSFPAIRERCKDYHSSQQNSHGQRLAY